MKYNVLVIAGTTESRQVIEKLLGENPNERILASVATELGKEMLLEYDIDVHVGRLDQDGFLALLKENPCEKIIDASHPYMSGVENGAERLFIRVLDNVSSLEGCAKAGYPEGHVFGKMPPFTVEDNVKIIRETEAEVLVSKDSGKTGGVDVKVEACRQTGIKMILIDRPNAL